MEPIPEIMPRILSTKETGARVSRRYGLDKKNLLHLFTSLADDSLILDRENLYGSIGLLIISK